MGRSRKPSAKRIGSDSDLDYPSNSVIFLSSSDDEEANKDLSLEIVERAMAKDAKRKKASSEVVLVNSDSTEDLELNVGNTEEKKIRRKIKRKKKSEKKIEDEIAEDAMQDAEAPKEEEQVGTADSVVTEMNEDPAPDNAVMRKLLRGPRYFDPGERDSITCFNCGEEGHAAVNCTMEKKKRPCFICGMIGHSPRHCTQGQDCYICKKRGHIAKNCPDKNTRIPQDSTLCLRCGDLGHEMPQCKNDYAPSDLKEIQCYVCKKYGHFCCVDFKDDGPKEISCYNCAQPGHTGLGCAKVRSESGDLVDAGPSEVCFKCGEEGHFARGCTNKFKFDPWSGGSATPHKPHKEHKRKDFGVSLSAPHDYGKTHKKKKAYNFDDRWNITNDDLVDARSSEACYRCGEEGHFVRECTRKFKSDRRNGGGSGTPRKISKEHKKKDYMGSQSAPHDNGKIRKKKKNLDYDDGWDTRSGKSRIKGGSPHDNGKIRKKKKNLDYDDGWDTRSGKSRIKGGWIVDDPEDLPRTKQRPVSWNSPSTPNMRSSRKVFVEESNGIYSTPRSPFWKRKFNTETPNYSASRFHNQHYNGTSSYYNSHDYY